MLGLNEKIHLLYINYCYLWQSKDIFNTSVVVDTQTATQPHNIWTTVLLFSIDL